MPPAIFPKFVSMFFPMPSNIPPIVPTPPPKPTPAPAPRPDPPKCSGAVESAGRIALVGRAAAPEEGRHREAEHELVLQMKRIIGAVCVAV